MGANVKLLNEAPELGRGLHFYLEAYYELLTERQIGMAVGFIPWSSILRYAQYLELDENEFEVFQSHIRALECADRDFEKDKGG